MNIDFYYLAEMQRKLQDKNNIFIHRNDVQRIMEIITDFDRNKKSNEEKIEELEVKIEENICSVCMEASDG